jgi:hypothetical protein
MSFFPANRIGRSRIRFLPPPTIQLCPDSISFRVRAPRSSSLPTKKRLSRIRGVVCSSLVIVSLRHLALNPEEELSPLFLRTDPREQSRPCDTDGGRPTSSASIMSARCPAMVTWLTLIARLRRLVAPSHHSFGKCGRGNNRPRPGGWRTHRVGRENEAVGSGRAKDCRSHFRNRLPFVRRRRNRWPRSLINMRERSSVENQPPSSSPSRFDWQ